MKTAYKTFLAGTTLATILGGAILTNGAYAETVVLDHNDFTFATCDDGATVSAHGVKCFNMGGPDMYILPDGDLVLGEDISLTGDSGVVHQGNVMSLNLNGHSLTNNSAGAPTLLFNGKNSTIFGTGAITNTLSGISVMISADPSDPSVVTINGGTFGAVTANSTTATINGGTFTGSGWNPSFMFDGANGIINGGTFSAAGASAMYFSNGADKTLEVNGGTFTSEADFGIEFMDGIKDLKITAGTFSGGHAGLSFGIAPTAAALSGGTYRATLDDGHAYGGIVIFGVDDIGAINNLLASGASYSDSSAEVGGTAPDTWAYLKSHNVTISDGSTPATEDESGVKSPNSGFITGENNATASLATAAVVATGLAAAGLGLKKAAKKEA